MKTSLFFKKSMFCSGFSLFDFSIKFYHENASNAAISGDNASRAAHNAHLVLFQIHNFNYTLDKGDSHFGTVTSRSLVRRISNRSSINVKTGARVRVMSSFL